MTRQNFAIIAGLSALSLGGYLLISRLVVGFGFPLDDAWIHQAYARNLANSGEWAFLPGQTSAGSTSPLWAVLVAIGYWLRLNPLFWTYLLGWVYLTLIAILGWHAFLIYAPKHEKWALGVAALLAFEWHLSWAAGSGMETLLAGVLITAALLAMGNKNINPGLLGLVVGFGTWVRPDLLTLLGPLGLSILLTENDWGDRVKKLGLAAGGFIAFFLPYLAFNRWLAGSWWPNTFYAKQAEYASLLAQPIWGRIWVEYRLPLVGVGALLLPGFLWYIHQTIAQKQWTWLVGVVWWFGYLGLYAWRLPVDYQHGRYVIPAMPIFFIWGVSGGVKWVLPRVHNYWPRILGTVWLISSVLVLVGFWILGGRAYAQDVGFIETEMVTVAKWITNETSPDALIAVHDIGAIGYFSGRNLLDMAGLVSPEVIPFIQDEVKLGMYLDANQVDYLVTFPHWYEELVRGATEVYVTNGRFAPDLGGENMAVYRWRVPE